MSQPPFETVDLLSCPEVSHGFFGRRGGVSIDLYSSLNVGPGSEDDPVSVAANRARVKEAVNGDHLLSCYQVHGRTVMTVAEPWDDDRPQADAMVTDKAGLALCILTADCAPVLLSDSKAGIVGAAHAGWRGAVSGVCEAAIEAMEALGADRERITAVVGPCIAQASYEVGPEFREAVLEASAWAEPLFAAGRGDRLQFNLPGYVKARLDQAGLTQAKILPHDTCAMEEAYFSNRRRNHAGEPDYGRNASVIMLRA
ncbi:MAG: peptidoglycan editing factor PgeF [Pseudomonadota bacterium]